MSIVQVVKPERVSRVVKRVSRAGIIRVKPHRPGASDLAELSRGCKFFQDSVRNYQSSVYHTVCVWQCVHKVCV